MTWAASRGPAVIVMARVPLTGEGKTRLRGVLSSEDRARLQEAFLLDTVEMALASRVGPVHVACTPAGSVPRVEKRFEGSVFAFAQEGVGLGERLLAAQHRVEGEGFAPTLVIGTDSPLLQPRHLRSALRALTRAEVCLGPSDDGGYYLLACRTPLPRLFVDVPWGTDRVLDVTLRRAADAGISSQIIETLYDVDTPADLERLRADLARKGGRPGLRAPRHTAAALRGAAALISQQELPHDRHE